MTTIWSKLCRQDLREEIMTFCKRFERIYLYGASFITTKALRLFSDLGIEIDAILVSDGRRKEPFINTYAVFELSEKDIRPEDGIIIGTATDHKDIYNALIEHGISSENILHPQWFKRSNLPKAPMSESGDLVAWENGAYFKEPSELDSLGLKYDTDKCSKIHNYLTKYEFFLQTFKDDQISVLELGVYKGASLKMWRDYFWNAIIYGVDINPQCKEYEETNIKVLIKDLDNEEDLNSLKSLAPTIIIDDASHYWSHQIFALYHLLPALKNGGIYILEDLETSFLSYADGGSIHDDTFISGYDFCSAISEAVCGRTPLRDSQLHGVTVLKDEIEYLASQIDMISFIQGSCIMIKR